MSSTTNASSLTEPTASQAEVNLAFGPLRLPVFRSLWLASTVSNIGGWMQDTAGIWLMTALASSPFPVALMQTAASLPVVMLGLLAGSTADIFDRRRLLILWQVWTLTMVTILCGLAFLGLVTPWVLLSLTFLMNIGGAMQSSAWQAIVPELVPKEQLQNAVTLNSGGINLARSLGPALGGIMVALFHSSQIGAAWTFLLNAVSFIGVIYALYRWRTDRVFKSALPAERLLGSVRAGLRYVHYSSPLRAALIRAFILTGFVSALWALLPLVAARDLHRGALGYGIFTGTMGLGALVGAATLPRFRSHIAADISLLLSSLTFVVALLVLAYVQSPAFVILTLLVAGFAWVTSVSTLNLAIQLSVPDWVRARALGVYQVVFSAGMALGSLLWGAVAQHTSPSMSLAVAATGLLLTLPLSARLHILRGVAPDLSQSPETALLVKNLSTPNATAGPVRIHVDYIVRPESRDALVNALYELKDIRLRNGVIRWGLFQDLNNSLVLSETFIVESWLDYLRQQERFTASDKAAEARALGLLASPEPPRITVTIFVTPLAPTILSR